MASLVVLFALLPAAFASSGLPTFKPGTILYDTDGDRIESHGGGMLLYNQTYYWVGQSVLLPPEWLSTGFNLYSSSDLTAWIFKGMILVNTSLQGRAGFEPPWRLERPKLLFNSATSKFILWWHFDTASFSMTSVGVATSSTVEGPYTQMGAAWQPDGQRSYDMTVWADPGEAGAAYIVRTIGGPGFKDKLTGVSRLNAEWTNSTGELLSIAPRSEAQCVFRSDAEKRFYIWGSNLTGWPPNRAIFTRSSNDSMATTWEDLGNPSNSSTTFNSQSAFIFPYTHDDGHVTLVYAGDRWVSNHGQMTNVTDVWLPLTFNSTTRLWNLTWHDSWSLADY